MKKLKVMIIASSPLVTPSLSFSALDKVTLIIPAAGSGSRLNKEIPKPYIQVAGRSILGHTVSRFLELEGLNEIIVATSAPYISKAEEILKGMVPAGIAYKVIKGGRERQHSIYSALKDISKSELIIIHDAVRPFVKSAHIRECCEAALEMGASVLGIQTKDTIKQLNKNKIIQNTPAREYLWQAQTPQVFKAEVITEAYKKAFDDHFVGTDDASLVERLGYPVKMVEGEQANFKITYPLDLELAQLLLKNE